MKVNVLLFTEIMSSLLHSGLSLQDSLKVAEGILTNKNDKLFCKEILKRISEGNILSDELGKFKKTFNPLYISFVKIGEETGSLAEVFGKLTDYLKTKKESKDKMTQNLMYPLLVLLTAVIVVLVIIFFVLPKLEGIFEVFGEVSDQLKLKINKLETGMKITGIIFLFFILTISVLSICYKSIRTVKKTIDRLLLRIPFVSKLIIFSNTNDFSFSMKLLSSAYEPFDKSILLSSQVVSNSAYKQAILNVYNKTIKGNQISESFENEKIFPDYLVSWIKIAEKNGNLSDSFSHIYEYFKKENDSFNSKVSATMEPAFILVTGIIVITIIVQFVIPIFNLVGTL